VREGRKEKGEVGGQRGVSNVLCCERKERYVERLWTTTTTNSFTEKARRDETRQRSQLREQASQRFRAHRSGAQIERGRECDSL
jgi:hypothetical protein